MADTEYSIRSIVPFEFDAHQIRIHLDQDHNPWWTLHEVCSVLGLHNPSKVASRLKSTEYTTITLSESGHTHTVLLVNEPGLYRLIMRSRKPDAERFQTWLFHEVLPSIRKEGKYEATALRSDQFPELRAIRELVEAIADARIMAQAAQVEAREAQTKADLAMAQQEWLTIREYVYLNKVKPREFPESDWPHFGRYLMGYCQQKNIPVRNQGVADRHYKSERAYHVEVIAELLLPWLKRRSSQTQLRDVSRQPATPDGGSVS